jgi:hypothetical protein
MTEMTTALDGLDNMATACHMKFLSFFSDKHRKVWNDEVCDIVVSNEANEYFDKIRDIVRCHGGFKSTVIDGELHILGVGDLSYVYGAFENELVPWMEACLTVRNLAVCNTPQN